MFGHHDSDSATISGKLTDSLSIASFEIRISARVALSLISIGLSDQQGLF